MLVSSSGEATACSAASIARRSPVPMPIPSSALPASHMIVRTSAKSRLIRPGSVTRSDTPWTPWRSTSSATRNASTIDVLRSSTDSNRLLGTTISVSTSAASALIPASAWSRRREPSNWNGRVTIPTVSAPSSREIWATIGAAPVPVPPPAPAAMNTMSDPRSIALIRSCSSTADRRPRSGSEPDPSPRVIESPMWSVSCAADCWSDCKSVLTARNSTPSISASTIRLTALTPAPPTPTTRIAGARLPRSWGANESATRSGRAYGSGSATRGCL